MRILFQIAVFTIAFWGALFVRTDLRGDEVQFNRDIRPILNSHCVACHGGVKQAADLSFVYPEQVLPPEGWVVEPGDPEESELMARVTSTDPEVRMPPLEHGPPLSEREIDLLHDWISQGAEWQQTWAFTKPSEAAISDSGATAWARQPLDHFVMERLLQEGLQPSADAEPSRWLRRVSLDLVGLPPSLAERDAFLQELSTLGEQAYASAVDRLLASTHFGERWASVWLDQVRYADSMGLGVDSPRTIWKYRDWVIRALNADMPYDQFTIKQIAGDLLPNSEPSDLIATACHRLTQTNEEGGTDDEEFRIAAVIDRVSTVWQTWQGITFGCVQCHSHPYEPIEHKDFYRFAAFFNNTVDSDLGNDAPIYQAPLDPAQNARASELDEEIEALTQVIWQAEYDLLSEPALWSPLRGLQATHTKATEVEVVPRAEWDEFLTTGTIEKDTDITLEAPLPSGFKQLTAVRLVGMPYDAAQALVDSEWGFVWSYVAAELVLPGGESKPLPIARVLADEPHPLQNPQESLNEKSNEGFSAYSRIHYPRTAALVLQQPTEVPAGARLRVQIRHRVQLLGAFSLVTRRGHLAVSDDPRFADLLRAQTQEQRERLKKLEAQRKEIESVATPILRERPTRLARPTSVFLRGLYLDKGERVEAGVPSSLPALDTNGLADRLALAQWLVSPENPLTARVAVNRFWARLFGTGLIVTEEDFGSSGEPPSHPELLDYLALRFAGEMKWSMKALLREIVLSSTYRQTSVVTEQLRERDPANRLLARGPRHRLSAEMVRDQALAVAGLLNPAQFGPPVKPPLPAGVWQSFDSKDEWPTLERGNPDRYRRSIYTYIKRSIPYPMFASFDQPSREFCNPRRLRSNTPLQALEMLNSEALAECAEALAERMREHGDTLGAQCGFGFELALGRKPTPKELQVLEQLHQAQPEDRALQAVATAILNLDELLMK